jgi:tetratricopeptide (TPR) repeat protein
VVGYKNGKWQKRIVIATVSLIYIVSTLLMNKTVLLILFGVYPGVFALFHLSKLSKKIKTIGVSCVLLLLLSGLGLMLSGKLNNTSYFGQIFTTDYGSGNERVRIWKNSYDILKSEPLLGKGSGDWKIEILNTPLRFTQAEQSMVFYKRAHNDFIQIAAENGLFGLGVILLFFIVVIVGLGKSKVEKSAKYILLSGVFGLLMVMNTSFPLEKIELLLLLFLFLLPLFVNSKGKVSKFKFSFVLIGLNLVLFSGALFWCVKEVKYFKNIQENNMSQLEKLNLDIYSITPDVMPTYALIATDYTLKNDYNNAIKYYEKALNHNPYHVHVLNGLGSSYYALGNFEKAQEYYQSALEVNPKFSETLLNHTALLFNNGDIDGALDELLKVVIGWEPANYYEFMVIITKAKCNWLIELHDEPNFEAFLLQVKEDSQLLYKISTNSRKTGACYEDELRIYFSNL